MLHSDAQISEYTSRVINELTAKGMIFSYATARSYLTASKATKGLHAKIPIITYNGSVILQNDTYEIIAKNIFSEEQKNEISHRGKALRKMKALLADTYEDLKQKKNL